MFTPVNSKLFDGFLYDQDGKILRLYMKNGQIRIYRDIPVPLAEEFMKAKSPGDFYFTNIRNKFPHD